MHMPGSTRPSAPRHLHTQPSATAWAPITWRHCCHGSKHGISTRTLWGWRGEGFSAAVAHFSDIRLFPTGGKKRTRDTPRLRFRLGLAVPRGLAFVWAFSCPVAILTALEAIPAVGVSVVSVGSVPGLLSVIPGRYSFTWSALGHLLVFAW